MNFNYNEIQSFLTERFNKFNSFFTYPFLWIGILAISYLYVHKFWLNPYYNHVRVNHSLVNDKRKNSQIEILPMNSNKFIKKKKQKLRFASLIVTMIITMWHYYSFKEKTITTFYDVIELLLPICVSYFIFSLFTLPQDGFEEEKKSNIYNFLPKFIDNKLIIPLIEEEREHHINCVFEKIKEWYKSDYNNVYFSALIMRMSGKNFAQMMNIKDEDNIYNDDTIAIMQQYVEDDKNIIVLDSIKELILKYIDSSEVKLYKFMEFIAEHEDSCRYKDKAKLVEEMRNITKKQKEDNIKDKQQKRTSDFREQLKSRVKKGQPEKSS